MPRGPGRRLRSRRWRCRGCGRSSGHRTWRASYREYPFPDRTGTSARGTAGEQGFGAGSAARNQDFRPRRETWSRGPGRAGAAGPVPWVRRRGSADRPRPGQSSHRGAVLNAGTTAGRPHGGSVRAPRCRRVVLLAGRGRGLTWPPPRRSAAPGRPCGPSRAHWRRGT